MIYKIKRTTTTAAVVNEQGAQGMYILNKQRVEPVTILPRGIEASQESLKQSITKPAKHSQTADQPPCPKDPAQTVAQVLHDV
jgi:hypothetical protein